VLITTVIATVKRRQNVNPLSPNFGKICENLGTNWSDLSSNQVEIKVHPGIEKMMTKPNQRLSPAVGSPVVPTRSHPPKIWPYWSRPVSLKPQRPKWQWLTFLGLGWALVVGVAILLAVAVTLGLFYRSELIFPGVHVQGLALGGRSTSEAVSLLQQAWQQRRITLEAGYTSQPVIPETLGINLDHEATIRLAHQQGRSLASLIELIKSGRQVEIAPVIRFRPDLAEKNLQILASQFETPAQDAGLRLVGSRVEATPAIPGQRLDIVATLDRLGQNPAQILQEGRFQVSLTPIEPALTDVSGPVAQANQLLAQTISIQAYDPIENELVTWMIEPEIWGSWLSVSLQAEDQSQLNWAQLDWGINQSQVQTFLAETQNEKLGDNRYLDLEQVSQAITAALTTQEWPVHLAIYHREQQHTVRAGETLSSIGYDYGIPYPWIEQANPGIGHSLTPGQIIAIPSPDVLLPLPAVENKRLVVSLKEQKMWVYEDGVVKWEWPVSTGIASSPTAPGIFQVQSHEPNAYAANWNLWMPNFMGIYRPVPTSDFMNGFHGFPTRNGSNLLWTDDLGHPVTYGAIGRSIYSGLRLDG
jgi:LysM repeat protein